jgi:hypothetical protein
MVYNTLLVLDDWRIQIMSKATFLKMYVDPMNILFVFVCTLCWNVLI